MTRNNNYSVIASKVQQLKSIPNEIVKVKNSKTVTDVLTYRDELWKSRFTTIPVFENEIINFSGESKSNDSMFRFANGTVIA